MTPAPEARPAAFTLVPIPGMERVRKNFEAISDGETVSQSLEAMKHIPLSIRFSLAERGYTAVRNDPIHRASLHTVFVGNVDSRDAQ
uniref:PUB_1 domain-containing protein n=1 Tax=Panagrellus redivivus TaxID=6233 RepID=A0A7E4WBN7_PANRE